MRLTCLLMLAVSAASFAEDPFACVDPDVVTAFLGGHAGGDTVYSTEIPGDFGALEVPNGFSLIGSQRSGTTATVIYMTPEGASPALQAAIDAMARLGWRDNSKRQRRTMGGFQTSTIIPLVATLCHEEQPYAISVNAGTKGGETIVGYTRFDGSQGCDEEVSPPPRHRLTNVMAMMPALTLPRDARTTSHGMSGSGDEASSQVDIAGAISPSELLSDLERQIQAQGWEFQTSWASRLSSGSVWMLNSDEDGPIIGTLHLIDAGEPTVRVRFSVIPAKPTKHANAGTWSSTSG